MYGYSAYSEKSQGGGDDTALNHIILYCTYPGQSSPYDNLTVIQSDRGPWGTWSGPVFCNGGDNPVVGFDVKEEGPQGGGDDTALNDIDLYCKNDNGGYISANVNTGWGSWKPKQMCPPGMAVMGLRTQVEGYQGWGDDTALNGLELYCDTY